MNETTTLALSLTAIVTLPFAVGVALALLGVFKRR